ADVHAFQEMVRAKLREFASGEQLRSPDAGALKEANNRGPNEPDKQIPQPQVLRVPLERLDNSLRAALFGVLGEQPFDALLKHSL
ncbi:hypothetical protein NL529_31170, partial [Klebsiella pneumoniae]|nr:hypothetical protein [Klebsiella pneumoniae]